MQSVGFETAHNLVGGFMEWTGDTDAL
jgi:hypothetical protein